MPSFLCSFSLYPFQVHHPGNYGWGPGDGSAVSVLALPADGRERADRGAPHYFPPDGRHTRHPQVPSFLPSFLSSFLSFSPSLLPSFPPFLPSIPSFYPFLLFLPSKPSFLLTHSSFLPSFLLTLPSFLVSHISFLPSSHPSFLATTSPTVT